MIDLVIKKEWIEYALVGIITGSLGLIVGLMKIVGKVCGCF